MFKLKAFFAIFLLLLLSYSSPIISYSTEYRPVVVDSLISSSNHFQDVREIIFDEYLYLLQFPLEKIYFYDLQLNEQGYLLINRRYLDDLYKSQEVFYGVQSQGIYQLYPHKRTEVEGVYSATALIKLNDSFYTSHYYGGISKWRAGELVKEVRGIEKVYDMALLFSNFVLLSKDRLYFFSPELKNVKNCSLSSHYSSISTDGEFLYLSSANFTDIYSYDCFHIARMEFPFQVEKVYVYPGSSLMIAFNSSHVFIYRINYTSFLSFVESVFESYKEKYGTFEELEEIENSTLQYYTALEYRKALEEIEKLKTLSPPLPKKEETHIAQEEKFSSTGKGNDFLALLLILALLVFLGLAGKLFYSFVSSTRRKRRRYRYKRRRR